MASHVSRPCLLRAFDAPKPWGWERWLTSTRPEGPARLIGSEAGTLGDWIAAHPEVLGTWARRIFGDAMPTFTKLIHTDFPSRVHLGFARDVPRSELQASLEEEQAHMRQLFAALRVRHRDPFNEYQARYEAWATRQSLQAWQRDDDDATAQELSPFLEPGFDARRFLRATRDNRARIVSVLNEIDLADEAGNLFLSSAGIIHAIFGLSLQTHPLDASREALQSIYGSFFEKVKRGASDEELQLLIEAARLPELRAANRGVPKNEAWLGGTIDGAEVLVEPQQSSDTTYSLADFYTPFTWSEAGLRFRKGDPRGGLSGEQIGRYLGDMTLAATPVSTLRRVPASLASNRSSDGRGWELFRLVDDPVAWPFFTAYQLELHGSFSALPPPGAFQELVVTRGRIAISDPRGPLGELDVRSPAFIPATLDAPFTLTAHEASTVMFFSVPVPRGGPPRVR